MKEETEAIYTSLTHFFNNDNAWEILRPFVDDKVQAPISLRHLDYFVVTYARVHDINYNIVSLDGSEVPFFVHSQYRTQLRRYTKNQFDPFCRGDKISFRGCQTAWKQLNFFRWAITHHVIDYAVAHRQEIAAAHRAEPKDNAPVKRRRGENTTSVPSVRCYVYAPGQQITISWEPTPNSKSPFHLT